MKTIILPGFSVHNRDWAYQVKENLNLNHGVLVHEWRHWSKGSFSLNHELEKIKEEIGSDEVNILAKSVGVYVAFNLIPKLGNKVKKIIFCGIASVGDDERKSLLKDILKLLYIEKRREEWPDRNQSANRALLWLQRNVWLRWMHIEGSLWY